MAEVQLIAKGWNATTRSGDAVVSSFTQIYGTIRCDQTYITNVTDADMLQVGDPILSGLYPALTTITAIDVDARTIYTSAPPSLCVYPVYPNQIVATATNQERIYVDFYLNKPVDVNSPPSALLYAPGSPTIISYSFRVQFLSSHSILVLGMDYFPPDLVPGAQVTFFGSSGGPWFTIDTINAGAFTFTTIEPMPASSGITIFQSNAFAQYTIQLFPTLAFSSFLDAYTLRYTFPVTATTNNMYDSTKITLDVLNVTFVGLVELPDAELFSRFVTVTAITPSTRSGLPAIDFYSTIFGTVQPGRVITDVTPASMLNGDTFQLDALATASPGATVRATLSDSGVGTVQVLWIDGVTRASISSGAASVLPSQYLASPFITQSSGALVTVVDYGDLASPSKAYLISSIAPSLPGLSSALQTNDGDTPHLRFAGEGSYTVSVVDGVGIGKLSVGQVFSCPFVKGGNAVIENVDLAASAVTLSNPTLFDGTSGFIVSTSPTQRESASIDVALTVPLLLTLTDGSAVASVVSGLSFVNAGDVLTSPSYFGLASSATVLSVDVMLSQLTLSAPAAVSVGTVAPTNVVTDMVGVQLLLTFSRLLPQDGLGHYILPVESGLLQLQVGDVLGATYPIAFPSDSSYTARVMSVNVGGAFITIDVAPQFLTPGPAPTTMVAEVTRLGGVVGTASDVASLQSGALVCSFVVGTSSASVLSGGSLLAVGSLLVSSAAFGGASGGVAIVTLVSGSSITLDRNATATVTATPVEVAVDLEIRAVTSLYTFVRVESGFLQVNPTWALTSSEWSGPAVVARFRAGDYLTNTALYPPNTYARSVNVALSTALASADRTGPLGAAVVSYTVGNDVMYIDFTLSEAVNVAFPPTAALMYMRYTPFDSYYGPFTFDSFVDAFTLRFVFAPTGRNIGTYPLSLFEVVLFYAAGMRTLSGNLPVFAVTYTSPAFSNGAIKFFVPTLTSTPVPVGSGTGVYYKEFGGAVATVPSQSRVDVSGGGGFPVTTTLSVVRSVALDFPSFSVDAIDFGTESGWNYVCASNALIVTLTLSTDVAAPADAFLHVVLYDRRGARHTVVMSGGATAPSSPSATTNATWVFRWAPDDVADGDGRFLYAAPPFGASEIVPFASVLEGLNALDTPADLQFTGTLPDASAFTYSGILKYDSAAWDCGAVLSAAGGGATPLFVPDGVEDVSVGVVHSSSAPWNPLSTGSTAPATAGSALSVRIGSVNPYEEVASVRSAALTEVATTGGGALLDLSTRVFTVDGALSFTTGDRYSVCHTWDGSTLESGYALSAGFEYVSATLLGTSPWVYEFALNVDNAALARAQLALLPAVGSAVTAIPTVVGGAGDVGVLLSSGATTVVLSFAGGPLGDAGAGTLTCSVSASPSELALGSALVRGGMVRGAFSGSTFVVSSSLYVDSASVASIFKVGMRVRGAISSAASGSFEALHASGVAGVLTVVSVAGSVVTLSGASFSSGAFAFDALAPVLLVSCEVGSSTLTVAGGGASLSCVAAGSLLGCGLLDRGTLLLGAIVVSVDDAHSTLTLDRPYLGSSPLAAYALTLPQGVAPSALYVSSAPATSLFTTAAGAVSCVAEGRVGGPAGAPTFVLSAGDVLACTLRLPSSVPEFARESDDVCIYMRALEVGASVAGGASGVPITLAFDALDVDDDSIAYFVSAPFAGVTPLDLASLAVSFNSVSCVWTLPALGSRSFPVLSSRPCALAPTAVSSVTFNYSMVGAAAALDMTASFSRDAAQALTSAFARLDADGALYLLDVSAASAVATGARCAVGSAVHLLGADASSAYLGLEDGFAATVTSVAVDSGGSGSVRVTLDPPALLSARAPVPFVRALFGSSSNTVTCVTATGSAVLSNVSPPDALGTLAVGDVVSSVSLSGGRGRVVSVSAGTGVVVVDSVALSTGPAQLLCSCVTAAVTNGSAQGTVLCGTTAHLRVGSSVQSADGVWSSTVTGVFEELALDVVADAAPASGVTLDLDLTSTSAPVTLSFVIGSSAATAGSGCSYLSVGCRVMSDTYLGSGVEALVLAMSGTSVTLSVSAIASGTDVELSAVRVTCDVLSSSAVEGETLIRMTSGSLRVQGAPLQPWVLLANAPYWSEPARVSRFAHSVVTFAAPYGGATSSAAVLGVVPSWSLGVNNSMGPPLALTASNFRASSASGALTLTSLL